MCLDDSEYMRNGDFSPDRLEAQRDAVHLVIGTIVNSHPENTIGCMTMANRLEMLVTLTNDDAKILGQLYRVKPAGNLDFVGGLKMAQLALKFRPETRHAQRIIAFVGSPILAEEKELEKLGKVLKKNNIAVDIINFGEDESNTAKLEAFFKANDKNGASHLLTVPAGTTRVLSDAVMQSPIVGSALGGGGGGSGGGAAPTGDFDDYGGIDPNMDPEMALALRASLEQHRAETEAREKTDTTGDGPAAESESNTADAPMPSADEDPLAAAMAMSLKDMAGEDASGDAGQDMDVGDVSASEMSEEALLQLAIQMSMAEAEEAEAGANMDDAPAPDTNMQDANALLADADFLNEALGDLGGVDTESEAVQKAVKDAGKKDEGDTA